MNDYREFRRLMRLAEDAADRASSNPENQSYAYDQLEWAKAYLTRAQDLVVPVAELISN